MSNPAVRLGDSTEHGGSVVAGNPRVMIEGAPAARVGDQHLCPRWDGCKPHVGGPIAAGSSRVFIGGRPAARVDDAATCCGPSDRLVVGATRVFLG